MTTPRVFVVNEPTKRDPLTLAEQRTMNLTPALAYGNLVHLLPAGRLPHDPALMVAQLESGLADFGPDDYLLLVGDLIAISATVALASARTGGSVNVLRWQRDPGRYEHVRLPIPPPAGTSGGCDDDLREFPAEVYEDFSR